MRMIVARTLRVAGYDEHEIVEAGNGIQALEVGRRRLRPTSCCATGTCRR